MGTFIFKNPEFITPSRQFEKFATIWFHRMATSRVGDV